MGSTKRYGLQFLNDNNVIIYRACHNLIIIIAWASLSIMKLEQTPSNKKKENCIKTARNQAFLAAQNTTTKMKSENN